MDNFQKKVIDRLDAICYFLLVVTLCALMSVCSSCSRSSVRFKGQGDIEYIYKGQNGPDLSKGDAL